MVKIHTETSSVSLIRANSYSQALQNALSTLLQPLGGMNAVVKERISANAGRKLSVNNDTKNPQLVR